jgi:hypothetical protein
MRDLCNASSTSVPSVVDSSFTQQASIPQAYLSTCDREFSAHCDLQFTHCSGQTVIQFSLYTIPAIGEFKVRVCLTPRFILQVIRGGPMYPRYTKHHWPSRGSVVFLDFPDYRPLSRTVFSLISIFELLNDLAAVPFLIE